MPHALHESAGGCNGARPAAGCRRPCPPPGGEPGLVQDRSLVAVEVHRALAGLGRRARRREPVADLLAAGPVPDHELIGGMPSIRNPDERPHLEAALEEPRLLVLRTAGKVHGLAGIRPGLARLGELLVATRVPDHARGPRATGQDPRRRDYAPHRSHGAPSPSDVVHCVTATPVDASRRARRRASPTTGTPGSR